MTDITLVYYTANLLPDCFAQNIRNALVESAKGKPIISVSQKPIDLGDNIYVDLKPCLHSVYEQIYIGASQVKTPYMACCEDDTLYPPEHFNFVPPDGTFAYNLNHWHHHRDYYYYRGHRIMSMCICPTDYMLKTMKRRMVHVGDESLKLKVGLVGFSTEIPPITFRHKDSLFGISHIPIKYPRQTSLPQWGDARQLWRNVYGE